ncbi:hypothetical protein TWF102_008085 [Orbilia oligospora]|uniref:Uncharacterized protein n=1 Tax=Orbilia oligospora TaxID=2813651 RepID=A0A7C8JCB1_ORBOL|nr:hypothetical protein TWF706_009821 [Orbilia oligospora]KAF3091840.1 hypothetical protein TWF103_011402 [Orbilia oligospora]KAF3110508.1 hypothetical protein TWF102_008085 [Orbilia oligospora]
MPQARPVSMPIAILVQGDRSLPPRPTPFPLTQHSVLLVALSSVQAMFLHAGGLELLIDMARAISRGPNLNLVHWTEEWIIERAYTFFTVGIFPGFVIDYEKTDILSFGHHTRTVDYNPAHGRFIMLNSAIVLTAEDDPINLIPIFKLIHTISHEISHAFLSYLFSFNINNQTITFTPPNINYLDRYGNGNIIGEAGFWFDSAFWGGAVFYHQVTNHSNGNPCVYRKEDNPQNVWVQLSENTLRRIIGDMQNATLPIVKYTCEQQAGGCLNTTSDGDLYQDLDLGPPKFVRAPIRLHCASLHPFTIGEYRNRVKVN